MKLITFFALTLLVVANIASARINFSADIMRKDVLHNGKKVTLEVGDRAVCYHDETVYIEAELLEEHVDSVNVQFTIATKNETGAFMVRGLPKLSFPTKAESKTITGSLRCDGPNESFTLLGTVERLEEVA